MAKDSRPFRTSTIRVLALLVVIMIGLTFVTDWLITSSEHQDFRDRYQEIELGMSESMVISLLGTPKNRSSEIELGQREGLAEAYERAAESEATQFLMWSRETDVVYAVGFNAEGAVAFVDVGGT